jgi:N-carbamoylputrescine amidase
MRENITVAAIAANTKPADISGNLAILGNYCKQAASRGAQLVLFPELSGTGFVPNHPEGNHAQWLQEVLSGAWSMAQTLDGELVQGLMEISRSTGVFLSAGMLENAGNVLYNTQVLVGEGRLWGRWRKMHIPLFEMQVYNGGDVPDVVETPLGRIGVNICFDTFLPESTRLLGVRNAEIVLFPFAADPEPVSPAGWLEWAGPVLRARCSENAVFGVACNYRGAVEYAGVGQRFPGGAVVVGPDGGLISGVKEEIAVASISRATLLETRARFEYTFRFRRPELYRSLAE